MTIPETTYYYLFRGPWFLCLKDMAGVITYDQSFEIWDQIDKTKELHALVVHERPLPSLYCLRKQIWNTTEEVFNSYYKENELKFSIRHYSLQNGNGERTTINLP